MRHTTVNDAAHAWVHEFNAIPQGVLEKLAKYSNYCDVTEITPPSKVDRVYVFDPGEYGEITDISEDGETFKITLDNGSTMEVEESDFEVNRDDYFPMWGTMWTFGDSADEYWLEGMGGLQIMADCGFRIYEQEDFGYVFGIDGCGYDFYEAHWIPLYKARGLQWHETGEE